MKKNLFSLCILFTLNFNAQDWTWMRGNLGGSVTATYGSQGISSPGNDPGGRHGAASWTDNTGNLWQFGGEGYASTPTFGWLNDLWKYDPLSNEWTWIRGATVINQNGIYGTKNVSAPTNEPGAREFPIWWKDNTGIFWLFGGDGYDAFGNWGRLNDLWKYDVGTNEWTWISGSNLADQNGTYGTKTVPSTINVPGGRHTGMGWVDASNNLWLLGGYGFPATGADGFLNDVWRYNITTGEWTWMSGSNLVNQNGIYGPKGLFAPPNAPGGREFPAIWRDPSSGAVWLFGGGGLAQVGGPGHLSDLWRYNQTTNMWAWMGGSQAINSLGNYGTMGVPSATNIPGGRYSAFSMIDNYGNLWLFGGIGNSGVFGIGRLNDIFRYTPSTDQWTWMKGTNGINQNGVYGTMGVSAPTNNPGSRYYNIGWKDNGGNMWVFGSFAFPSIGPINNLNDLWKFDVSCSPVNVTDSASSSLCGGNSTTLTVGTTSATTINWYNSSTSTVSLGTGTTFPTGTLTAGSYTFYAEGSPCTMRVPITVIVNALPTVSISVDNTVMCAGQTMNLTASGASSYTWNTSATSSVIAISPTVTTTYSIIGTDSLGCANTFSMTQTVVSCTGVNELLITNSQLSTYPNPNKGNFVVKTNLNEAEFILYDAVGKDIYRKKIAYGQNTFDLNLSKGIYFYTIKEKGSKVENGKMVVE
jgi:N-acetylneuraminic acid mutarotase